MATQHSRDTARAATAAATTATATAGPVGSGRGCAAGGLRPDQVADGGGHLRRFLVVAAAGPAVIEETDWSEWRKCRVCGAPNGSPCIARSGRVVWGRTDGVVVKLPQPHTVRERRTRRGSVAG